MSFHLRQSLVALLERARISIELTLANGNSQQYSPLQLAVERLPWPAEHLRGALAQIAGRFPSASLLVYGSCVTGADDEWSDVDLLVVLPEPSSSLVHRREVIDGIPVDITTAGFARFDRLLTMRHQDNNNWLLNALCEARLVGNLTPTAALLLQRAQTQRIQGPPAPTVTQLKQMRSELESRSRAAELAQKRAASQPGANLKVNLCYDQLVARSLYFAFVTAGKWTTSYAKLLRQAAGDMPELHALALSFAGDRSTSTGRLIAQPALQRIDAGIEALERKPATLSARSASHISAALCFVLMLFCSAVSESQSCGGGGTPTYCEASLWYRPVNLGNIIVAYHSFWYQEQHVADSITPTLDSIVDGGPSGGSLAAPFGYLTAWRTIGTISSQYASDDISTANFWFATVLDPSWCTAAYRIDTFPAAWDTFPRQAYNAPVGPNSNTFAHQAALNASIPATQPPECVGW